MRRKHLGSVLRRRSRRWNVERLEDRWMLAVAWVTTELDVVDFNDDLTSLREAIFATNVLAGSDTIEFDSSLVGKTIGLTLGELRISDDLEIIGNKTFPLVIDAGGREFPRYPSDEGSQVLLIDDGDDESLIDVELRDLVLTGGRTFEPGAGIHNRENLRLDHVRVERNWSNAGGGGIFSMLGKLEIAESVISGNQSIAGGGISVVKGTLDVVDSEISNNIAYGGSALHLSEAETKLKSTSIREHAGDTIVSNGGRLEMDACNFTDNDHIAGHGTGISIHHGEARILRSVLARNFGTVVSNLSGTLEIERTSIVDNFGGSFGSAIAHYDGELNIRSSTITGNVSYMRPSALNLRGAALIESSTISGNVAELYGAIQIRLEANEQVHFAHCTITNNRIEGPPSTSNFTYWQGSVGQLTLDHTIVSGNWFDDWSEELEPVPSDIEGAVTAFWSVIGEASIPVQGNHNLIGVDPRLGPLADNGGVTFPHGAPLLTHALMPDSPLIDRGDPTRAVGAGGTPEYDQRGLPFGRVYGGRIDIGAVEWQPMPAAFHGDFNDDGATDSADYSVWRDTVGRTGIAPYSSADGDGDGDVDQDDYGIWKVNFGRVMAGGGAAMGRESGVTQSSVESTLPPAEPGAVGLAPVVGLRAGLGNQPPALPGVWWPNERTTRGAAVMETGRDTLRHQSRQHSAAVADRALVAWLAERREVRGGDCEFFDHQIRESGDGDNELAGMLGSLEMAELVGI